MKRFSSALSFFLIVATQLCVAQQPAYKPKAFVTRYDSATFKAVIPKQDGFVRTFIETAASIWDVDESGRIPIHFSRESVMLCIEGQYSGGKRNGLFTFYLLDSADHGKRYKLWEQEFMDDHLDGEWRTYNLQGTLVGVQQLKNDSLRGTARWYGVDGKTLMEEQEFLPDERQYTKREFFPSGKLRLEVHYVNGRPQGLTTHYYESGAIKQQWTFKEGVPNGSGKKYYENGRVQEEVFLTNGELDHIRKYYYDNGQLWIEQEYRAGKPWNILGNYDQEGKKRNPGTLKDGDGTQIFYNEDGSVREVVTYEDGKAK